MSHDIGYRPNTWPISHLGAEGFCGCQLLNNQSVLHATSIRISCPAGGIISILWGDGTTSAVLCDGVLNNYIHNYVATGQYVIQIVGSTGMITDFRCYSQSWIGGDLGQITHGLSASLVTLYLHATPMGGDLSSVSGLTSLVSLSLYATPIGGNLSSVSGLTSLSTLYLSSTAIVGNLSSVSGLTSLSTLYLHSTAIVGNLSSVSGLTSLVTLYLHSTAIDDYTSGVLPPWGGATIRVDSVGLDSGEVDDFLIDFAAAPPGAPGTLNIAGTNAPRTGASDAAVVIIIAAGWALTVNP